MSATAEAWIGGLAVVLLAFSGCVQSGDVPAPTDEPTYGTNRAFAKSFHLNATACRELLGLFRIPLETATAFVPATYTPLGEPGGQATAFVGLKHCDDATIDGESIGPASTSDVGVFIDEGEPNVFHYYQVWWYTDNERLLERLIASGFNAGLSEDTLSASPRVPATQARAGVDGPRANYTLVGNDLGGGPGGANDAVGWFDGSGGTVRIAKSLIGTSMGGGTVTLTGDGEAARLVGASAVGGSLWNEYDMVGRVH
jgi:hypothetical protein